MQQSLEQLLTVKAKYGEELRRFSIPTTSNWQQVLSKITGLFSVQPDSIVVKYEDDEKEMITIDSDGELNEAIRVYHQLNNNSGILCLRLTITDSVSKKSVIPVTQPATGECEKFNHWEKRRSEGQCWRRKEHGGRGRGRFSSENLNNEELKAKLLQLEEKGFKCKMRNVRLLHMYDGDVEKVSQFLLEKKNKRNSLKEALDKLNEQGFNKHGINICLLRKFDGDIDKVVKILNQSKELEAKGYDHTMWNIRLLSRCDGDIQKVEEIYKAKKEKFEKKREKKSMQ